MRSMACAASWARPLLEISTRSAMPPERYTVKADANQNGASTSIRPAVPTIRALRPLLPSSDVWKVLSAPAGNEATPHCPHVIGIFIEHMARECDRVDAEIEQCTTGQVGASVASIGGGDVEGKVSVDGEYFADCAIGDAALKFDVARNEPGPHRLHQKAMVTTRCSDHFGGLRRVDGEGLLTEHVLPGVKRGNGHVAMVAVGRGDVDDVDIRICEQFGVAAVSVGDSKLVGECGC